ncbi:DM DNA binding domain-containing protein [Ditylenchus destructor]|uniref:DM DNA binding domain-containing protein n=1 Tax=Ditylenchus destructor TaxID=166010 RepID=A0AAD4N046_9BILA|nr:DM DNA binding domain-containing protein [Ditylenchus destructor]
MPKEQYMCQLCANHGRFNQPKKGHKQRCPHRNCVCHLCALNNRRRELDQMERQLRHSEDNAQKGSCNIPNKNGSGIRSNESSKLQIRSEKSEDHVTFSKSARELNDKIGAQVHQRMVFVSGSDQSKSLKKTIQFIAGKRKRSTFHSIELLIAK